MLLVPSRRRLAKLRNFCNTAVASETTCPAIIIVDAKDYKDNEEEYKQLEMHHFPNLQWKIHISESEGMGDKVRETESLWKTAGWVAILNDDHHIVTKHWDQRLIKQLNGKNFITCNDRWNAPMRAAGATVWSMDIIKAVGFPIFPKQIDHLAIDDVWETIGRSTGCWRIDMSVIIEHHHVYQDYQGRIDDTHLKVYGNGQWQGSPQALDVQKRFQGWIEQDGKGVVDRVMDLQNRGPEALQLELPMEGIAAAAPPTPVEHDQANDLALSIPT